MKKKLCIQKVRTMKLWLMIIRMKLLMDLLRRYGFIFDCVNLIYYKCPNIYFKRAGSYIDSSNWIKKEKKQQ